MKKVTKTITTTRKQWNQKIEIYSKNEKGEIKLYDGKNATPKKATEKQSTTPKDQT